MNTVLNSTPISRTALWHGQWRYCGRFHLPECHALRRLDHDWIDRVISVRRQWGRRPSVNHGGSWRLRDGWEPLTITEQEVSALHAMCDFLTSHATPRKIMIANDNLYVYANDLGIYQDIQDLGLASVSALHEVILTGTPNTVRLRRSEHTFRSYFRGRKLTASCAVSVRRWLRAQESVRLSPSLLTWCDHDSGWLSPHYFLDHDGVSTVDMLHLISPGVIRCTLPIITDK